MQPHPAKLPINIKRELGDAHASLDIKISDHSKASTSISHDLQYGKIGEPNDLNGSPYCSLANKTKEPNQSSNYAFNGQQESTLPKLADSTSEDGKVHSSENEDDQYSENAQNQLVIYDPAAVASGETAAVLDPVDYQAPPLPRYSFHSHASRVLPSIGAFTVQCAICFKWRLIPTKEKYEEIREHILEQPFVCEVGREWRPEISCADDPDILQDGSRLWAIDKPNIAQPPPGWQRLLRIRGEGGTRFADVYYVAPSGKRLRSTIEIQKYLMEHPNDAEGVSMSQFSFQIPRPLQENYVRKRTASSASHDGNGMGEPVDLEPADANPLAWADPEENIALQLEGPGHPDPFYEAPNFEPQNGPAKRSRAMNEQTYDGD